MKRLLSVASLLALSLSLMSSDARANIVYDFSGATFSGGGTLTGSFTTNDARTQLLDFDITTTGVGIGHHYTPAGNDSDNNSTSLPCIIVLHAPAGTTNQNLMQVTFDNLTPSGSTIKTGIGTFASFEQNGVTQRDIVSGSVVAVPEPSTAALFGLGGLGLAGYLARRRRR